MLKLDDSNPPPVLQPIVTWTNLINDQYYKISAKGRRRFY